MKAGDQAQLALSHSDSVLKTTCTHFAHCFQAGVAKAVADLGFDPLQMARVVIKGADGDVVPLFGSKP